MYMSYPSYLLLENLHSMLCSQNAKCNQIWNIKVLTVF